jgi:hypothetical protein
MSKLSMKNLKLKTKLTAGAVLIAILIMVITTVSSSFLIYKQNRKASDSVLNQAAIIIKDSIKTISVKLSSDSKQMATTNDMASKIKFLIEEKENEDQYAAKDYYREITVSLYGIARAGKIWRATVYDNAGDLVAFAFLDGDTATVGYPQFFPEKILHIAKMKPGKDISSDKSWTTTSSLTGVAFRYTEEIPENEQVRFSQINDDLCLTALAPSIGQTLNFDTDKLEAKLYGFVSASRKLDDKFVSSMARMSGTNVNIFNDKSLYVGTLKDYKKLDFQSVTPPKGNWKLEDQPIFFQDKKIAGEAYFQGVLPLFGNKKIYGCDINPFPTENCQTKNHGND